MTILHLRGLVRQLVKVAIYGITGSLLTLVVVFVVYLNGREDLSVWHTADLDEEFNTGSDITTFEEYLALEDRLFRQLDEEVYDQVPADQQNIISRYTRGSLSDPERWERNWNRSYELPVSRPRAGVLMLHGMSDSPYSLRSLAQRLHESGVYVLGLRIPGHGTAPSGLTTVTWQDMAAAVRIAMRHLAEKTGNRPLHIVGYSNGGALAVNYVLTEIDNTDLPSIGSLALISPEIGLPKVAAFAVWQARLGRLLGLDKLAWNSLLPEYDPYKYGSFAVNAGDVAYRLTQQIQLRITKLGKEGKIDAIPPILAFSSIVDATVVAPALVDGLFDRIPGKNNELVLFDINRITDIEPILVSNPSALYNELQKDPDRTYKLSIVTNVEPDSKAVKQITRLPGSGESIEMNLGLHWPGGMYSLSHVALPFSPKDPLYGFDVDPENPALHLGSLELRGERGVLQIPASEMLRLRSNPFYSFLESEVLAFFRLENPEKTPNSSH